MYFLYNISLFLTDIFLKVIALFNPKIKLGVHGRQQSFKILEQSIHSNDKVLWFHCASLGEYEQGLPVFKELKSIYPTHKIVMTFFSPSGYEIKKNNDVADVVIYLPLDTKNNARKFISIVNPELTVFVKYDIWPNLLNELHKFKRTAILISALFRKNQSFFKSYGNIRRSALFSFDHIFVQNEDSKKLLNSIGYHKVTVSGDTRFDRVLSQLNEDNNLGFVKSFKEGSICVVAGSTWPEDEIILAKFINSHAAKEIKFIIAPHNIKRQQINQFQKSIKVDSVLFSEKDSKILSDYKVLIIDTIGILSKIYSYADIAYVGGAMGTTGLHNTLEPAVFGIPIIIGKHYEKFPEAHDLITLKGMFSINNYTEFENIVLDLVQNKTNREIAGRQSIDYIKKNTGAVIQIINFVRK